MAEQGIIEGAFTATPAYHDSRSRVGDFLRYPRRVLIEALEQGFSNDYFYTWDDAEERRVVNPFLYSKKDGETAKDSRLEIADGWTRELEATNPRPIILCSRDTMTFQDSSIGGLNNPSYPWGKSREFADTLQVPLIFHCFAREDVESEELALVTTLFLRMFREFHLKNTRLLKMTTPAIGAPTPIKTDARVDLFDTQISFLTAITISWKVKDMALKSAKDVVVSISLPSQ